MTVSSEGGGALARAFSATDAEAAAAAGAQAGAPHLVREAPVGPVVPGPMLRWPRPPSREGRKTVVVHVDPKGFREMKILALDLDRPLQSLMIEAMNDYLERHERPRCANGPVETDAAE